MLIHIIKWMIFVAAAWLVGMGCRCKHRHNPHPSKPCSRYPPPARPAPKGGSLSGRSAGYLSPSLACARPPPPPKGGSCVYPSCVRIFEGFMAQFAHNKG